MNIVNKIFKLVVGVIVTGISIVAGAFAVNNGDALLGAVPSNSGFPGIYNATGTDLVLRDGYGSALATDQYGRVIISASSTYGNLIPTSDNTFDLGSLTNRWRTGYFGTSVSSTKVILGAGTNSDTALQFTGDPNTGLYWAAADTLGFAASGNSLFYNGTSFYPGTNNARNLGTSALRWQTQYLATSQIFSSGATGILMYNTADETTTYDRLRVYGSSNTLNIAAESTDSGGSARNLVLSNTKTSSPTATLTIASNSPAFTFNRTTGNTATQITITGTQTQGSSGNYVGLSIAPTINQSSAAAYTGLLVNPTETSTGSGAKSLIAAQVGGTNRFVVDNLGNTTLSSAATTGLRFYNTADETTNYERATLGYSSNVFTISTDIGGTGSNRNLQIGGNNRFLVFQPTAGPIFNMNGGSSGSITEVSRVSFTSSLSSGTFTALNIAPSISQSGTAGYNALLINPGESSTGSGSKRLISAQVGSADRFSVDNTGKITLDATVTAGGTTGAQTINKPAGCVNFAAAATSLVVTNSVVSASSIISPSVQTNDSTLKSVQVVPTSGSFTLYANAAATAETKVCFVVYN